MRDAVAKLRAMPPVSVSIKKAAAERVAMLRKILDLMKQMMIGATPAQARAMAAQLKAIASELASLARLLSEGGSAPAAAANSGAVVTREGNSGTNVTDNADSVAPVRLLL